MCLELMTSYAPPYALRVITVSFGTVASAKASDPAAARAAYVAEYREKFANPYSAAALGYIDEVIRPRDTRPRLCAGLAMLANKRVALPPRKHGNIPL